MILKGYNPFEMIDDQQPILISGSHRSGTTWVGSTIAYDPSVFYIHEPLKKYNIPFYFCEGTAIWYPYIGHHNEEKYYSDFRRLMHLRPKLNVFKNLRTVKKGLKMSFEFKKAHLFGKQILIKDPLSLFSVPWIHEKFNTKNIILIRHPAASISSLVKNKWSHDFTDF